jgi:hypothetical protein
MYFVFDKWAGLEAVKDCHGRYLAFELGIEAAAWANLNLQDPLLLEVKSFPHETCTLEEYTEAMQEAEA